MNKTKIIKNIYRKYPSANNEEDGWNNCSMKTRSPNVVKTWTQK